MNGALKLKKIREKAKREMKYIPRGDEPQNILRMIYWNIRLNSLGKNPKFETKEDCLKYAIKEVTKEYPEFKPRYNKNFFKIGDGNDK